ncbi:MAG: hypothetical protein BWX98_02406 [Candidatus Aminicenantes bacterium ADurb.Bin147]|nr:MAG: hypothetical protein BWX98_02406 [Candidatus Aminicenantes bacterium ADurb.Bin147]
MPAGTGRLVVGRKRGHGFPDDFLGLDDVHPQVFENHPDRDSFLVRPPRVVVGGQVHRRVADLGLAEELGLGGRGHPDQIAPPDLMHLRFRPGRKRRPLHADVSRPQVGADAETDGDDVAMPGQLGANRLGQRDMGDAAPAEKGAIALRLVDELVGEDDVAGADLLPERADGVDRDQPLDPEHLEAVHVGPVVDLGRAEAVTPAVTAEESHLAAFQGAENKLIRGVPPRGFQPDFLQVVDALDLV